MRVGFNARGLSDPLLRGFNRYTFCLLKELQTQPDVELFLYTDNRSPIHPFYRSQLKARVVEMRAPKVLIWEQVLLPMRLLRDRIDIFHAPCEAGLPVIKVCPYVLTYHGIPEISIAQLVVSGHFPGRLSEYLSEPPRTLRAWWLRARSRLFRKLYLRIADVVITPSEFSKGELLRFLKLPHGKVRVTHEAADDAFSHPVTRNEVEYVKSKYGLPDRYVLFVGGFDRHKNAASLLRVFCRLNAMDSNLALVLVGGGDLEPYQALAGELGLREREEVFFLQLIPDGELRVLYQRASVFVTLSWHEGFCLPVVEAMSSGAPVVASRFGAIPEIMNGGGMLVDPQRPEEVVTMLRDVLEHSDLREKLRERALARAHSFSWERTAEQTVEVYRELLSN